MSAASTSAPYAHAMEHFRLEQVADHAWAAVALPDAGAVGNAGFVRSGGTTVVFDTLVTPQAARDLRAEAERIAPVGRAVNSHWHPDHVRGNVVFADVPIAATERTRELIVESLPRLEAMKREDKAPHLEAGGTRAEVARTIDELEQVLPDELFLERLELDGATVETLGGGHSESDAFLTLGEVIFTADLVVIGTHPLLVGGNPERWIEILDALEERAPRAVVPGHGPVGSVDDVRAVRGYIESMLADPGRPPEPGWDHADLHERNADFLRGR